MVEAVGKSVHTIVERAYKYLTDVRDFNDNL